MNKPRKIPLIADPTKYYYLPWEVDEYIKYTESEINAFEKLVEELEIKDVIIWDGERWVLSQSFDTTARKIE